MTPKHASDSNQQSFEKPFAYWGSLLNADGIKIKYREKGRSRALMLAGIAQNPLSKNLILRLIASGRSARFYIQRSAHKAACAESKKAPLKLGRDVKIFLTLACPVKR